MRLCLAIPEIDTELVVDAVTTLARYNARTYTCGPDEHCTRSPWNLRYDARAGDSRKGAIVMRDAVTLLADGSGACGELAGAYAGWLMAHGYTPRIVADETGPVLQKLPDGSVEEVDVWHVVVRVHDGRNGTIDPARPDTLFPWRNSDGLR